MASYEQVMEARNGREWRDGDDRDLWEAGYEHAREEIRRGLERTYQHQLRQCRRLQDIIDERCEHGSLMGASYDGRIYGMETALGAIESSLHRMGIELGIEW